MKSDVNYRVLLSRMRRQLGLSQEDLARKLGVSYASVNRWENGQANPSKLAKSQLAAFCEQMAREGSLKSSYVRRRNGQRRPVRPRAGSKKK